MKLMDLTDQRFGKLVVISRVPNRITDKGSKVMWLCKCDCGNQKIIAGQSLIRGVSKSCGCYRNTSEFNDYFIENGIAHVKCKTGEFIVDAEDIDRISFVKWHIGKHGYAYCKTRKHSSLLHRIIVGANDGDVVDHIDRNRLDNRKSNLRIVDQSINVINKRAKIGESGEQFITYNKSNKYYSVYIDGEYKGGSYDIEKAKRIRDESLIDSRVEKYNYDYMN